MNLMRRVVKTTIMVVLAALITIGVAYLFALFVFGETSPKSLSASVVIFMIVYSILRIVDFVQWSWKQSE